MASVAGLAPARVCLKGRARELLCIHGLVEMACEGSFTYSFIQQSNNPAFGMVVPAGKHFRAGHSLPVISRVLCF